MPRFSANLGFLWSDLPIAEAIRSAHRAGFNAVECHWPYDQDAGEIRAALAETGLPMLGLNTSRGGESENGLAALPGRGDDARAAVDEALAYAGQIGAEAVHVMAGIADGPAAEAAFLETLRYASDATDLMILIEPLNRHDAPGYFLRATDQAAEIIARIGAPNLKLMFDCYHVGRGEGDLLTRAETLLPIIGHIQFAAVPDRGAPDHGELHYPTIFAGIDALGWTRPLGAEYRAPGSVEDSLAWMKT